ncbi:MAG: hypothetical protein Q8R67_12285 [Rhodoferax sp.]|nr:hypothetical protein [Rhodoferax sp.]MDP3652451.1 hypothetical protein [Rhodoferax sp.]
MTPSFSWVTTLLLVLAWSGAAYWAGDHNRDNAWLAKQVTTERKAREALEAEVQRGQVAARASIAEAQALQQSYTVLKEKFDAFTSRGPLVVWRNSSGAACAGDAVPGSAVAPARQPEGPGGSGPGAVAADAGAFVSLSAGAIWMWNSALAGTDTPAGACGAADPTAPACSVDAGLGLEAAWANHVANAQTCAEDRLRHQRLIDFVNPRPAP